MKMTASTDNAEDKRTCFEYVRPKHLDNQFLMQTKITCFRVCGFKGLSLVFYFWASSALELTSDHYITSTLQLVVLVR